MTKPVKARLDADRSAKPRTRLIRKSRAGACVGPHDHATHIEHKDGTRTALAGAFKAALVDRGLTKEQARLKKALLSAAYRAIDENLSSEGTLDEIKRDIDIARDALAMLFASLAP